MCDGLIIVNLIKQKMLNIEIIHVLKEFNM